LTANYSTQFRSIKDEVSPEEWQTRLDLAACYRLTDVYGMTDLIYNHITARIPGDEDHLLINLYGLEPSDAEICSDLSRGRRQLAQIWLDVETEQLESLYRTPFGQLTDNLIRSDFAREPLSQDERAMRQQLAEVAADLRHPRALNALIAALLYYPIEQVSLPADPALLPPWLSESLRQHGAQPATSD